MSFQTFKTEQLNSTLHVYIVHTPVSPWSRDVTLFPHPGKYNISTFCMNEGAAEPFTSFLEPDQVPSIICFNIRGGFWESKVPDQSKTLLATTTTYPSYRKQRTLLYTPPPYSSPPDSAPSIYSLFLKKIVVLYIFTPHNTHIMSWQGTFSSQIQQKARIRKGKEALLLTFGVKPRSLC